MNPPTAFDVIGDIHGDAVSLRILLGQLGYRQDGEDWDHPEDRQAVFLGDYIDRGPRIRETLFVVRGMVEAGRAVALMGNHEFNALAFHTPDGRGGWMRQRTPGKIRQHRATLDQFVGLEEEWRDWLDWFRTLPVWWEGPGLRGVHATWDTEAMAVLREAILDEETFLAAVHKGTREFRAIETVLKGLEVPLPGGMAWTDHSGIVRKNIRAKWWLQPAGEMSVRDLVFPENPKLPEAIPGGDHYGTFPGYGEEEPPVFFGHYALPCSQEPAPVRENIACLDYGAGKGGTLAAYRFDGECRIDPSKYVSTRPRRRVS